MATASNNDIAKAIYSYSKENTAKTEGTKNIVSFLYRKKLLSRAPLILKHLEKIINTEEGRTIAKITSVEKLQTKTRAELEQFLKKRYSAKNISFIEIIDPALIGGIKIEVNDEVVDLTVKNRIHKLQEYLTR